MNTIIRKISVGRDYPNGAIHYQVGSVQNLKHKKYEITSIKFDKDLLELSGELGYNIYIKNIPTGDEPVQTVLWKTVIGLPTVVENNIDLD